MMRNRLMPLGILAASILLGFALAAGDAFAIGSDSPAPPASGSSKPDKKKSDQKKSDEKKQDKKSERDFIEGYKAARALVLEGKYREGIAAFHALGHDDHPDVANYLGYASRKAGDYDDAKIWYEKALAADPKHTRTWQYYGLWHLEQGNRLKAEDHLQTIKLICGGTSCEDYISLKSALDSGKISY